MIKIIVDKIPKEAKECPFAEFVAMTNKHCCMFQKGLYSRCDLECNTECKYLKEKKYD